MVSRGLVPEPQVHRALNLQQTARCDLRLGSILLLRGEISEQKLLRVLMDLHGLPAVPWRSLSAATPEVIRLLPAEEAFRLSAVPYAAYQKMIGVAFASPSNAVIAQAGSTTGMKVLPAVTPEAWIRQAHERFYGRPADGNLRRLIADWKREAEALFLRPDADDIPRAPQEAGSVALGSGRQARRKASSKTLDEFIAEALAAFDKRSIAIVRESAEPVSPASSGTARLESLEKKDSVSAPQEEPESREADLREPIQAPEAAGEIPKVEKKTV